MSDHDVIDRVSRRLRDLLSAGLTGTAGFVEAADLSLDSPGVLLEQPGANGAPLLSLYCYQVVPNASLRNQPHRQIGDHLRHPPLALDLHYLLTPLASTPGDSLALLGRAAQILAAASPITAPFLASDLQPTGTELRIELDPVPLEELTRLWSAFNQAYHLSLAYRAQYVAIDSVRPPLDGPPVTAAVLAYERLTAAQGPA